MQQRITVDDLFSLWQPTGRVPLHLSPDGSALALTAQTRSGRPQLESNQSFTATGIPSEMVGSHVLLIDTATGDSIRPFSDADTSWGARWSPDGAMLAAYFQQEGPACLGIWHRESGKEEHFPGVLVRPFFGFEVPRWTPDSSAVVIKLRASKTLAEQSHKDEPTEHPERGGPSVFSYDPEAKDDPKSEGLIGWADGYICDLGLVDVSSGGVQKLAENWNVLGGWEVSPDGRAVGVLRYTDVAEELQQFYFDLTVLPLGAGEAVVLAKRIPMSYGSALSWSPDGTRIAYIASERGKAPALLVASVDEEDSPIDLTPASEGSAVQDSAIPRWSADGSRILCPTDDGFWDVSAAGKSGRRVKIEPEARVIAWVQRPMRSDLWQETSSDLLFLAREEQTKGLALLRVDPSDGKASLVEQLPKSLVNGSFGMEADGSQHRAYLLLEAADHPAELWKFEAEAERPRRLMGLNPRLEKVPLGRAQLIDYHSTDGESRQAALLLPPDYQEGGRAPLLVTVYAGSLGSNLVFSFRGGEAIIHPQLYASRGYAVLFPDIPLTDRNPLSQIPGQVLPAINRVVEMGIADPNRVGLLGNSYGGYTTLALLVHSTRFAAAVANAGIYDLTAAYTGLDSEGHSRLLGWAESGQGRTGGTLWEQRDSYIENSPFYYLDRVTTPVLLTCGSEDFVSPRQAEAVFVALRRLEKRVELLRYEGEGHWPGMWSEANYRDLCERVLAWFDSHLRS